MAHETQFKVKGADGRRELFYRLLAAEKSETPSATVYIGDNSETDIWDGGVIVKGALVRVSDGKQVSEDTRTSKLAHTFAWLMSLETDTKAEKLIDVIGDSRKNASHWSQLNADLGITDEDKRIKPQTPHPIKHLVLIDQDGKKQFLDRVQERFHDLEIYHMDGDLYEYECAEDEDGLEPISDAIEPENVQATPYPVEVWDGTLYGEFAERCTKENHIPKELFIEGLKTCVGAVISTRLSGKGYKGIFPRQYTVAVAPPQSGKDTAFDECKDVLRGAEDFDVDGGPGLLSNEIDSKKDVLGARIANFASEVGAIDAANKCNRLLYNSPEFGSLIDKSSIVGSGTALLELILTAWDSSFPNFSTAKERKDVPARLFLSLLTSIQPDRLSQMQVSSGLYSRVVWIPIQKINVAALIAEPQLGDFQKRLFEKIKTLEKDPITISVSDEAKDVLNKWFVGVKAREFEDEQVRTRINILTLRNALHLAWLRDEPSITAEVMGAATRISDWQLSVRADLFVSETDNPNACHQGKILKALRKHGEMSGRKLWEKVNGKRVGTEIHDRALKGLLASKQVKKKQGARIDSQILYIPKEQQL